MYNYTNVKQTSGISRFYLLVCYWPSAALFCNKKNSFVCLGFCVIYLLNARNMPDMKWQWNTCPCLTTNLSDMYLPVPCHKPIRHDMTVVYLYLPEPCHKPATNLPLPRFTHKPSCYRQTKQHEYYFKLTFRRENFRWESGSRVYKTTSPVLGCTRTNNATNRQANVQAAMHAVVCRTKDGSCSLRPLNSPNTIFIVWF